METLPQISIAECKAMEIVRKYAPISTNEITGPFIKTTSWDLKTMQTFAKRLAARE